MVDFREQCRKVSAAILIAKIDLGAETTVVRAAARCLDFGAETGLRVVEAGDGDGYGGRSTRLASAGVAG